MHDETRFRTSRYADTSIPLYRPLGHRPELDVALARAQGCLTDHPRHGERRPGGLWGARFCENDGRWIDCDEPTDEARCPCCGESWA